MGTNSLLRRLQRWLAWSSPLLVLVVLFGFVPQPASSPSTLTSGPNAPSSRLVEFASVKSAAVTGVLRGFVGPGNPHVVLPLVADEVLRLKTGRAVSSTLWCAHHRQHVQSWVRSSGSNCVLMLSTNAHQDQPWTLSPRS